MVGQGAGSRIIMDMARTRRMPHALARVSPRTGVPVRSILITATANIVITVWAATRGDGLDILTSVVNVGALTAFILLHISVIGYFLVRRNSAETVNWVWFGVVPAVGAVLLVLVLASATRIALVVGFGWFIVGIVTGVLTLRRTAGRAARGA